MATTLLASKEKLMGEGWWEKCKKTFKISGVARFLFGARGE
jgi:hypothetical protein